VTRGKDMELDGKGKKKRAKERVGMREEAERDEGWKEKEKVVRKQREEIANLASAHTNGQQYLDSVLLTFDSLSHKNFSHRRERPRNAVEILSTAAQAYEKIAFEMVCNRRIILKVAQEKRNSIGHILLPISGL